MPPRLSWRKLFPGLAMLAAVIVVVIGVVLFAGVGRIRGEKIRLHVLTDQARGVLPGSEVWLEGQPIGVVEAINFRPPSSDSATRVVIEARVSRRDAEQIRHDSRVQVRAGANVVGPIVVYVSAGTPASPPVQDGDTLRARPQSDLEETGSKLNVAMQGLGPLVRDARAVIARTSDPKGSLGALMGGGKNGEGDDGVMTQLRESVDRMRELFAGSGRHTDRVGSDFMARAGIAFERVDSIRSLLRSDQSSFGRFRRDTSLAATVSGVRDEIAELRATLARSEGALGRFENDSAFAQSMARVQRELTVLVDDIRRRPLRYVHF